MKKSQMFEYKLITFPLASYVLLKKHGIRTRNRTIRICCGCDIPQYYDG